MTSSDKKILQVGKFFHPEKGGIESITKTIFDHLKSRGSKSDILCFSRSRKTKKITHGSAFVIKCGMLFQVASTPISFHFFYWFFRLRNKYDVIHIHVPNPLAAVALLLFPVKGKVVVHWHSDILTHKLLYFFLRFFENLMLKRADLILATSPVYKDQSPVLASYAYKVQVLSCSTSDEKFVVKEERVRQIKHAYNNRRIIFTLGRFIYYKGFEYLVEAAKHLPNNYVVLIGGGGPLRDTYEQLISKWKLSEKVFLIHDIAQEDVGNYYAACDVFCLPSCQKTEAFGIVLLEAMSFAKPIVATNINGSGVSWVNVHNVTGVNVEIRNPAALAIGIQTVFAGDYDNYSLNARQRFEQYFTEDKMIDRLQHYYNDLLEVPKSVPVMQELQRRAI